MRVAQMCLYGGFNASDIGLVYETVINQVLFEEIVRNPANLVYSRRILYLYILLLLSAFSDEFSKLKSLASDIRKTTKIEQMLCYFCSARGLSPLLATQFDWHDIELQ